MSDAIDKFLSREYANAETNLRDRIRRLRSMLDDVERNLDAGNQVSGCYGSENDMLREVMGKWDALVQLKQVADL